MRRKYFVNLIKYIKDVYNIENEINNLTDGRVKPSYKKGQVIKTIEQLEKVQLMDIQ